MPVMRRAALLGLLAMAVSAGAPLQMDRFPAPRSAANIPPPPPKTHRLADQIGPSGVSGWFLADLETGEVLDSRNPQMAFAPASVAKLPTAAFALERLGADHSFATRLVMTGTVEGGVLKGDLALVGGGDPDLDTDQLLPMVLALKALGVRRVDGRFLVDVGPHGTHEAIDPGQPADAAYNPSVSGLNLNYNRVRVEWPHRAKAAQISVTARATRLNPPVSSVRVIAQANNPGGALQHTLGRDGRVHETWTLESRLLKRKGARWLPVRRPGVYCADAFASLAAIQGISLPAPQHGRAPGGAEVVAAALSRPLDRILEDMLYHSTNVTAEAVGLAASAAGVEAPPGGIAIKSVGAVPVSAGQGLVGATALTRSAASMNSWAGALAGTEAGLRGFELANHSGLSVASRVTPEAMADFLRAAAQLSGPPHGRLKRPDPRRPGGVGQILRPYNIAAKTEKLPYEKILVVAKTGTMNFIRGLAGYITTPSGRQLVFAIFSNDLATRFGSGRAPKTWIGRSRTLERALLREWVRSVDQL